MCVRNQLLGTNHQGKGGAYKWQLGVSVGKQWGMVGSVVN